MPAARPKKENISATPPSDDGHLKDSHAENSKSKRKYVCKCPTFPRTPSFPLFTPRSPHTPHILRLLVSPCRYPFQSSCQYLFFMSETMLTSSDFPREQEAVTESVHERFAFWLGLSLTIQQVAMHAVLAKLGVPEKTPKTPSNLADIASHWAFHAHTTISPRSAGHPICEFALPCGCVTLVVDIA